MSNSPLTLCPDTGIEESTNANQDTETVSIKCGR